MSAAWGWLMSSRRSSRSKDAWCRSTLTAYLVRVRVRVRVRVGVRVRVRV